MRHARRCPSRSGGECSCIPSYQAQVWSARDRKPIRKTFPTVAGALAWRQETQVALRGEERCVRRRRPPWPKRPRPGSQAPKRESSAPAEATPTNPLRFAATATR